MVTKTAVVCPEVRKPEPQEPIRRILPPIRKAVDLNSAVAAVNQIAENLNHKHGQPEWVEIKRNTQRVRIHNPEDENQWVEVERITQLLFENKVTKAQLEWNYKQLP